MSDLEQTTTDCWAYLERINDRAGKGALGPVDYVLYGDFREGVGFVHITLNLLNRSNGVVITSFTLSELGRNNLPEVALRAARKVFDPARLSFVVVGSPIGLDAQ